MSTANLECPAMISRVGEPQALAIIQHLAWGECIFRSITPFEKGDAIGIALSVPGAPKMTINGRVTAVSPNGARSTYTLTLEPLVGADHADFDRILEVAQRYAISHAPKDVPQAAAGLMRATARASLDVPIRYRVGEGEFMTGRATNISLGGLHMVAGAGLKPGSPISLRFTLASNEVTQRGKELALQARVVAHQPNPDGSFNYNIAFHSVPNEEHDQIGTYVANTLRSAAV